MGHENATTQVGVVKEVKETLDETLDQDVAIVLWDYFGMWSTPMDLDYWIEAESGTIFEDAEAPEIPFGLYDGYDFDNIVNIDGLAFHKLQVEVWETYQVADAVLLDPDGSVLAKSSLDDNMENLESFILDNLP